MYIVEKNRNRLKTKRENTYFEIIDGKINVKYTNEWLNLYRDIFCDKGSVSGDWINLCSYNNLESAFRKIIEGDKCLKKNFNIIKKNYGLGEPIRKINEIAESEGVAPQTIYLRKREFFTKIREPYIKNLIRNGKALNPYTEECAMPDMLLAELREDLYDVVTRRKQLKSTKLGEFVYKNSIHIEIPVTFDYTLEDWEYSEKIQNLLSSLKIKTMNDLLNESIESLKCFLSSKEYLTVVSEMISFLEAEDTSLIEVCYNTGKTYRKFNFVNRKSRETADNIYYALFNQEDTIRELFISVELKKYLMTNGYYFLQKFKDNAKYILNDLTNIALKDELTWFINNNLDEKECTKVVLIFNVSPKCIEFIKNKNIMFVQELKNELNFGSELTNKEIEELEKVLECSNILK